LETVIENREKGARMGIELSKVYGV